MLPHQSDRAVDNFSAFPVVEIRTDKFRVCDVNGHVLIQLVRDRPEIWDRRISKHSNQPFVQQSWNEISEIMGIPVPIIRKKWKNLRDCFGVELSKPYPSKWTYFAPLCFLTGVVKPRERVVPIPVPRDPLAIDSIDEDLLADDPLTSNADPLTSNADPLTSIADPLTSNADEDVKFDPSTLGVVPIISISPEPAAKKPRGEPAPRTYEGDENPDFNYDSLVESSSSSDIGRNLTKNAVRRAIESYVQHPPGSSNFTLNLNSNDSSSTSLDRRIVSNPKVVQDDSISSKITKNCRICSKEVDFNTKDSVCKICSNCRNVLSTLWEQSNVKDSKAPLNANQNASDHKFEFKALQGEFDQNPKFDAENHSNTVATEDEKSDHSTEDEDFFRSILPHVRKIPPHLKLQFRNKVHDLVESFAYPFM